MVVFKQKSHCYTPDRHKMKPPCGLFGARRLHFMPVGSIASHKPDFDNRAGLSSSGVVDFEITFIVC